jgi:hypothetical protein
LSARLIALKGLDPRQITILRRTISTLGYRMRFGTLDQISEVNGSACATILDEGKASVAYAGSFGHFSGA